MSCSTIPKVQDTVRNTEEFMCRLATLVLPNAQRDELATLITGYHLLSSMTIVLLG